jgi:hypothetical protein
MSQPLPDGGARDLTRRDFVKAMAATGVALVGSRPAVLDAGTPPLTETAVARLYRSVSTEQRPTICFPIDHPTRWTISSDGTTAGPQIENLTTEQQALCLEIFQGLCSEDGRGRFLRLMQEDQGGFEKYHVAFFGGPGTDQPFEWLLTGRHVTLRADGNRAGRLAFAGPIFYGHSARSSRGSARNVWSYQAEQANRVFRSFDAQQRARAFGPGICVDELDDHKKRMVQQLVETMLRPFHAGDALAFLGDAGATDGPHMVFHAEHGAANFHGCDIWKLEGRGFSWYHHGSPHVHAWLDLMGRGPVA